MTSRPECAIDGSDTIVLLEPGSIDPGKQLDLLKVNDKDMDIIEGEE